MKKTFIITYDLINKPRNYEGLIEAIKSYNTWAKINDSTWAVYTDESAKEIRDNLKNFIKSDDKLFIIKSGKEAAWRNVNASKEWLKKYLPW